MGLAAAAYGTWDPDCSVTIHTHEPYGTSDGNGGGMMASHLSAHCSMLAFLAEGQRLFCHSFFVDGRGGVNLDLYIRCGADR